MIDEKQKSDAGDAAGLPPRPESRLIGLNDVLAVYAPTPDLDALRAELEESRARVRALEAECRVKDNAVAALQRQYEDLRRAVCAFCGDGAMLEPHAVIALAEAHAQDSQTVDQLEAERDHAHEDATFWREKDGRSILLGQEQYDLRRTTEAKIEVAEAERDEDRVAGARLRNDLILQRNALQAERDEQKARAERLVIDLDIIHRSFILKENELAAQKVAGEAERAALLPQWREIETAPTDAEILVWDTEDLCCYTVFWSETAKAFVIANGAPVAASHWQPLPDHPGAAGRSARPQLLEHEEDTRGDGS